MVKRSGRKGTTLFRLDLPDRCCVGHHVVLHLQVDLHVECAGRCRSGRGAEGREIWTVTAQTVRWDQCGRWKSQFTGQLIHSSCVQFFSFLDVGVRRQPTGGSSSNPYSSSFGVTRLSIISRLALRPSRCRHIELGKAPNPRCKFHKSKSCN